MPQPKLGVDRMFVMDTSALINIWRWYAPDIMPKAWENMELMVRRGEMIAPIEVLKEVERRDDEIKEWCKNHREMFIDVEDRLEIIKAIKKVQGAYDKQYWETNIQQNLWADPWVIALALATEYLTENGKEHPVIVTSENQTKPNRIPTIARRFGLKSIKVQDFIRIIVGGSNGR